jgi:hypothetical protein
LEEERRENLAAVLIVSPKKKINKPYTTIGTIKHVPSAMILLHDMQVALPGTSIFLPFHKGHLYNTIGTI